MTTARRKVLVTGAGGFIGSHLARDQLARGNAVTATDVDLQRLEALSLGGELRCERLDLRSSGEFARLLENVDTVFHLAAAHLDVLKGEDYFYEVNVGATEAALYGMGRRKAVVILGGDGKGQDFTPLKAAVEANARAVILIGRDAPLIESAIAHSGVDTRHAATLPEAVQLASRLAQPGDAVLLSPACASFDMFRNYLHRAEVFVDDAFTQLAETHTRDFVEFHLLPRFQPQQMNPGRHFMRAPGERPQHPPRFVRVGRFSQRAAVQPHQRVGPEHHGVRMTRRDFHGFGPCIDRDQLGEAERGIIELGYLRRGGAEFQSGRLQKFPASRRSGGEDELGPAQ
jgi:hypothetical protein